MAKNIHELRQRLISAENWLLTLFTQHAASQAQQVHQLLGVLASELEKFSLCLGESI